MEPIKFYHKDIDMNKLKIQLKMLTDAIKVTSMHGVPIKQVTCVETLCQVFNIQPTFKTLLSEIHKLLRVYLTNAVSTSMAERNFSVSQRLKTYLRRSMSQALLNHCIFTCSKR